jgi:hypothetical protein
VRTAIIVLFLMVLLFGFYKKNKLPITSIIPVWLFVIFVPGLVFNSIITNLEFIEKPKSADPYISYLLLQYFFMPMAILSLIRLFNSLRPLLKGGVVLLGTLALMAAEFIISLAGILKYIHWNAGYSALLWMSIILISLVFYRFVESDFINSKKEG